MNSPLIAICFCQGLLFVITLGAPLESNINGKPDVEETDLLHLKPAMGQFLGNPTDLEKFENTITLAKSPVDEYVQNEEEKEEEDEESLNDLLKTVLITLRDHPDIIMDILQEEERKNKDFQQPSDQLNLEPKRVQKKGGEMYKAMGDSSEESHSSEESEENSESRDGSYYKNKYDKSKSSEESDESNDLDLAQYYKQKYANSKDNDKSSSSSSSSSSEESKQSERSFDKRVPEQPEETIDITSLPEEDDIDLTKIISEGGLEDLPEYKEKLRLQKPSKFLTSDASVVLGKIPKSVKSNGKSAKPKPSALKPVITEADMSESNKQDNRESSSGHKTTANEKTEKSDSQQTPQSGS